MELEHLQKENFEKTLKEAKKPVLVDFFATWCGPCKMLSPILENVKDEVGEDVLMYKFDIDEDVDIAKNYGIMSVPTMIIFKNGEEVERLVGLRQKGQIVASLNNLK